MRSKIIIEKGEKKFFYVYMSAHIVVCIYTRFYNILFNKKNVEKILTICTFCLIYSSSQSWLRSYLYFFFLNKYNQLNRSNKKEHK